MPNGNYMSNKVVARTGAISPTPVRVPLAPGSGKCPTISPPHPHHEALVYTREESNTPSPVV